MKAGALRNGVVKMGCVSFSRCREICPRYSLYCDIEMRWGMEMRPVNRDGVRAHDNGVVFGAWCIGKL